MAVVLQLDTLALEGEDALWDAVALWARYVLSLQEEADRKRAKHPLAGSGRWAETTGRWRNWWPRSYLSFLWTPLRGEIALALFLGGSHTDG